MANATARVGRAFYDYRNDTIRHSWDTVSVATQLYTGVMVGLDAAGYLQNFDDTQSLKYWGILLENHGNPIVPTNGNASGTGGDGTLDVDLKQPRAFELNIASVAITDIGRRVYALDNQTGTLDPSATTYANLIGTVKDLVYAMNGGSPVANYALVAPVLDIPNGSQLQVLTTAAPAIIVKPSLVILNKAGVIAATLANPTTGSGDGMVIRIQSVTAQAHTVVCPGGFNGTGTTATFAATKGNGLEITAFGGAWYANWNTGITFS